MARKGPVVFVIGLFVMISLSCTNPITSYFSTQTAVMETATATMWTPTPTFTNTPTNTPTFTPTPEFLYMDDFEDPNSDWKEGEDAYAIREYSDGGYRFKSKQQQMIVWSFVPTNDTYRKVRIEVEGTKIGGPADGEMGILARFVDTDNFTIFVISDDGYGIIFKYENGEFVGLSGENMERVRAVNSGELNKIAAVLDGENLELYVNGDLAISATDSNYEDGEAGLVVGTFDVGGTDILFDNFVILPL